MKTTVWDMQCCMNADYVTKGSNQAEDVGRPEEAAGEGSCWEEEGAREQGA